MDEIWTLIGTANFPYINSALFSSINNTGRDKQESN